MMLPYRRVARLIADDGDDGSDDESDGIFSSSGKCGVGMHTSASAYSACTRHSDTGRGDSKAGDGHPKVVSIDGLHVHVAHFG